MKFLPDDRRVELLAEHVPWIDESTRDYLLSLGAYWYSDRSLGEHLELYDEDRERLRTWSIKAIDVSDEERAVINREKTGKQRNNAAVGTARSRVSNQSRGPSHG